MPRPGPAILAAAAIVLAVAGIVVANLFDEELSPEAKAIFERPPRPLVRDSGWAFLVGFDAPAGVDPRDHSIATMPNAGGSGPTWQTRRGDELAVRATRELLCQPQVRDCVQAVAAQPHLVDAMAGDNAILLARYDALQRTTGLADVVDGPVSDGSFPSGAALMSIQRVRLSQIGAAVARGRLDQALAWLEADAAFHRRWLGEAETILSKLLALRTFTRTVAVAGQVARAAPELSPGELQALERVTAALSKRERSVGESIRTEATFFPWKLGETASRTLLRNATLNFAAPLYTRWMQLDEVEPPGLAAAIESIRAAERAHLEPGWRWAYNHSGRTLTAEGHYDMAKYIYRVRDGDAFTSMMRCAVGLRGNAVAGAPASGFIATDPACRDPYLGRPFAWDPAKGELSFAPRDEHSVGHYGGSDGRVTFKPYSPGG